MKNRKGFTLIELLVVLIIIAIIAMIAAPSYIKSREASNHRLAIGKLVELSNAVRMFNEDNQGTSRRVAGTFCKNLTSGTSTYLDPRELFLQTSTFDAQGDNSGTHAYLKRSGWTTTDSCNYNFQGYTYYVCNPEETDKEEGLPQPEGSKCSFGDIATMQGAPDTSYAGRYWRIQSRFSLSQVEEITASE